MTKSEFVVVYQDKLKEFDIEVTREIADLLVKTVFETIEEVLLTGGNVGITNFGVFKTVPHASKPVTKTWGDNIGEVVYSAPTMYPSFKPSVNLVGNIKENVPFVK